MPTPFEEAAQGAEWYQRFLESADTAFASRHFEIAFHLLVAAMHCAEDLQNEVLLREVLEAILRQGQWLDENEPDHSLSSKSAHARGNESIYQSAAGQARVILKGLEVWRQAEMLREGKP